jgi:hypothetical protein
MAERERFTAYITKYALTSGILAKDVELCHEISTDMISVIEGRNECYHGKDWHRTEAAAIVHAEEMQAAKLKSIDKQRKRVAALKFGAEQKAEK